MTTDGIQTDFSDRMSYGDYLQLDTLLSAQKPLSPEQDELLFITIHQVQELWMKLLNSELDMAIRHIRADELGPSFKCLSRVSRIQMQLIQAWDVLATMTPPEYTAIRPYLASSSGFQSHQYREIEFILGNKNANMLAVHQQAPEAHALLDAALHAPSLYDEAIRLLARNGLHIDAGRLDGDWTQPTVANESVKNAWLEVYRDTSRYWALYELAEKLVDMETAFRFWRFRHVTTVERVIGFKTGTGGTAGVSYLRKMLDVVLFPELFALRTAL